MICSKQKIGFTKIAMKTKVLFILYLIFTIVCLGGRLVEPPHSWQLDYLSKPFLMPILMLYLASKIKIFNDWNKMVRLFFSSGLFFAWLGDLLLMIAHGDKILFIFGLLAFLVMQIQYIFWFKKNTYSSPKAIQYNLWSLPSLILGIFFYLLLFNYLDLMMKVAVAVYAMALVHMTLAAIHRKAFCTSKSFVMLTTGAFLFMFSDMMIALNNFYFEKGFMLAGFWIMLTYALGQWLIIEGISNHQANLQQKDH